MDVRHAIYSGFVAASLGIPSTAIAQMPPIDCSEGAIPDGPLVLRRPGVPDLRLPVVKALTTNGGLQVTGPDQKTYRARGLEISDRFPKDIFDRVALVETGFLVADGQRFDGRIFRLPAAKRDTPEHEAQDRVSGQVVYQHWSVKLPAPAGSTNAPGVDVNHVFFIASARVEFGKQSGKTLPGKLHLCVPGNQSVFGGELKEPIEIVGSFTATLE